MLWKKNYIKDTKHVYYTATFQTAKITRIKVGVSGIPEGLNSVYLVIQDEES